MGFPLYDPQPPRPREEALLRLLWHAPRKRAEERPPRSSVGWNLPGQRRPSGPRRNRPGRGRCRAE